MEKVNLLRFPFSWYAAMPQLQEESGSNPGGTAQCLPENSFPPGSRCSGSFPSSVSREVDPHQRGVTEPPARVGAHPGAQHTSGFACMRGGQRVCRDPAHPTTRGDEKAGLGCQAQVG